MAANLSGRVCRYGGNNVVMGFCMSAGADWVLLIEKTRAHAKSNKCASGAIILFFVMILRVNPMPLNRCKTASERFFPFWLVGYRVDRVRLLWID